jgi:hypothetical protein
MGVASQGLTAERKRFVKHGPAEERFTMREECVVAEFADIDTARLGLEVLARSGYGEEHVSVITRNQSDAQSKMATVNALEKSRNDTQGISEGTGVGSLLGTAISIPLAASTLIGPFFILGPIVGAGLGAAFGGMLGGAGDKEAAAKHYRQSLEDGGILLIITGDKGELLDAEASIKTAGPARVTRFASPEHA